MLHEEPIDIAAFALELRCLGNVAVLGSLARVGEREEVMGGEDVVLVLIPLGIIGQYFKVWA